MQRLLIVAPLAEGTHTRATELLAHGPPFDPGSTNLDRHAVYLTESEVVFAFDGSDVEWEVDDLAEESAPGVEAAIERWRELLAGPPRIAREAYFWQRGADGAGGPA